MSYFKKGRRIWGKNQRDTRLVDSKIRGEEAVQ